MLEFCEHLEGPLLALNQPLGSFKLAKQLGGKLGIAASLIPHLGSLEGTNTMTAYGKNRRLKLVFKEKLQVKLHKLKYGAFICPPTITPKLLHLFSSSKN